LRIKKGICVALAILANESRAISDNEYFSLIQQASSKNLNTLYKENANRGLVFFNSTLCQRDSTLGNEQSNCKLLAKLFNWSEEFKYKPTDSVATNLLQSTALKLKIDYSVTQNHFQSFALWRNFKRNFGMNSSRNDKIEPISNSTTILNEERYLPIGYHAEAMKFSRNTFELCVYSTVESIYNKEFSKFCDKYYSCIENKGISLDIRNSPIGGSHIIDSIRNEYITILNNKTIKPSEIRDKIQSQTHAEKIAFLLSLKGIYIQQQMQRKVEIEYTRASCHDCCIYHHDHNLPSQF
jgi:hypothetical protein